MRIFLAALFVLLTANVFAADIPVKAPYPKYYWGGINWNGVYAGVGGGGAIGSVHGGLASIAVGINFQSYSRFLVGIESDFSVGKLSDSFCSGACNFESRWIGTTRIRAGYSFGRTMLYLAGGVALTDVRLTGPTGLTSTTTKAGYSIGGGVEYDLNRSWSLRVDYRHNDFGTISCGTICIAPSQFEPRSDSVQLALVFRFFQNAVEEFSVLGPPIRPPPF